MCGAYGFSLKDANDAYTRFAISNTLLDFQPRYNIRPGQMNPVITKHSPNTIALMFWGLIPYFAKDSDSFKYKTINARAETVASLPTYRKPFRTRRAIIPATYFFEWDKTKKPSVPHLFKLKNADLFGIAGLYDIWVSPIDGTEIHSYTIITTEANALVGKVHPRMPVILKKEVEEDWLNPDTVEPEHLQHLLVPYPTTDMEEYTVSRAVNSPKNDTKNVIKPEAPLEQGNLL